MCQSVKTEPQKVEHNGLNLSRAELRMIHMSEKGAYPHKGGCRGCQRINICNCCGAPAAVSERCTNGRCTRCHTEVCTPSAGTSPVHGYGTRTAANKRAAEQLRLRNRGEEVMP